MTTMGQRIDICIKNREIIARVIAQVLQGNKSCSETELSDALLKAISKHSKFYPEGWYDPPPHGIGVLFADISDNFERSKFPTLRTEPHWPSPEHKMKNETVGFVYVSPVHKASGIIGDISISYYYGDNPKIQAHLQACLGATEAIAELAQVGMTFQQLYRKAETLLTEHGLHNRFMVTIHNPKGSADFGHTFPWTHEDPTPQEQKVIESGNFQAVKSLISSKRLYLNPVELFTIPENIVFGIEPRLGSLNNPSLPAVNFYLLVIFKNGIKQIISNCKGIFDRLEITYMRSKF